MHACRPSSSLQTGIIYALILIRKAEQKDQWVFEQCKERFCLRYYHVFDSREAKLGLPLSSGNFGFNRPISYLESNQQTGRRITGDCTLGRPGQSKPQVLGNVR